MMTRRMLFLIVCIVSYSMQALSQISSTGYTIKMNPPLGEHCSLETLKNHFSSKISNLDPIEGLYDAKWISQMSYAHYPSRNFENSCCIGIVRGEGGFYLYAPYNDGYGCQTWLLIQRIGDTPLYNFIYLNNMAVGSSSEKIISSKERVLLKDYLLWEYAHELTDSEIENFGNGGDIVTKVFRQISAIKFFPAQSSNNATSGQWSGTGFALNKGYIVTNYHVVEGAKSIKVKGVHGNFNVEYNANVISVDKVNDLAIIKIQDNRFDGFGSVPYKIKTEMSDVGENIFVLGYPLTATMGDEIKLTTGVISAKTGFKGDVALYQISAPVQPGNSGGPLFDSLGNLIGIVNSKHKDAENVSYAIKTSYLLNLIESASLKGILPLTNSISTQKLADKVKRIKNMVFMIVCTN